jgi:hypothetical protein
MHLVYRIMFEAQAAVQKLRSLIKVVDVNVD